MKLRELIELVGNETNIVIWSQDRDGEVEEIFNGTVPETPWGLMKFEVASVDVDLDALSITLDEVPKGYL